MIQLLEMWALVEVLGLICLPLTTSVFHNLPDRGWAFSKAIGIALLAFCVWLPLMCLHFLPFSQLFILGVLLLLLACNVVGCLRARLTLLKVLHSNLPYIITGEVIFLGMTCLLGWVRSYGPQIQSFEMFMDEGFIASIMRSPHFPPNDMWLSGYPINYYYYAQYSVGVLAKLLGQSPSIAFNTGICTFYGLTAVNLFGVTSNIVGWAQHRRKRGDTAQAARETGDEAPDTAYPSLLRALPYGLLTMLMGLVLGNLAATQQWWEEHGDALQFDWFAPSRVIDKTINEFPAFSFLLSCFHAHVLTLAFTVVAIALAFNLFLERGQRGGGARGIFIFGSGWRLPLNLCTTALILGGLFTMNGWDFPTYTGLAVVCIALQHWLTYNSKLRLELVLDVFTASLAVIALSFVFFAPFYLNFISPSQGFGIVAPTERSPLANEILIYGVFAFVFLSLLITVVLKHPLFTGGAEVHPAMSRGGAPAQRPPWLQKGVLTIAALVVVDGALGVLLKNSATFVVAAAITACGVMAILYKAHDRSHAFVLLLGSTAFFLVALCELIFLRDVFAGNFPRMNTIFKFYFQAWALLSITSGAGLYFILEAFGPLALPAVALQRWLQRGVEGVWALGLLALLLASAIYPLAGTYARTEHFLQRTNSLDGLAYLQSCTIPDCDYTTVGDYYAIHWLNSHVSGDPVIVEAVGDDYSSYARISAFTGLPTLMGWVGHEYQWRVNWLNSSLQAVDFNNRTVAVTSIYTNNNPTVVLSLMARYHAQYLYVGQLEQLKYPGANLRRFAAFMRVAYSAYGVTIYQVGGN